MDQRYDAKVMRHGSSIAPGKRSVLKQGEGGLHESKSDTAHIVILLLVGALPTWPYSSGWGYGPSGGLGLVLLVLVVLLLVGKI